MEDSKTNLEVELDREILSLVKTYQRAIHTQDKDSFCSLWTGENNCLISITSVFNGLDNIYQKFLIDGIRAAYTKIELIADDIKINRSNDALAIVVFSYHTECIKRDTGEPFGIRGIETQVVIKQHDSWKLAHIHYSM